MTDETAQANSGAGKGLGPLDPAIPEEIREWVSEARLVFASTGHSISFFARLYPLIDKGTVSRYLNGKRVPSQRYFLDSLLTEYQSAVGKRLDLQAVKMMEELQLRALEVAHPHDYKVRRATDALARAVDERNEAIRQAQTVQVKLDKTQRKLDALKRDKAVMNAAWEEDHSILRTALDAALERQNQAEARCRALDARLKALGQDEAETEDIADLLVPLVPRAKSFPVPEPVLGNGPPRPMRWWAPWGHRSRDSPDFLDGATPRDVLLAGVREYHGRTARLVRPIMAELSMAEAPEHLFITCVDSRVVPNLITASGPGDLFIARNVGNIVPRFGSRTHDDSMIAAIEYAANVLNVKTITVCGHSECGAMAEILAGTGWNEQLPGLSSWLNHATPSLHRFLNTEPAVDMYESPLDQFCKVNVMQQLDNLMTHPWLRRKAETGEIELIGMYLELESASVHIMETVDDQ